MLERVHDDRARGELAGRNQAVAALVRRGPADEGHARVLQRRVEPASDHQSSRNDTGLPDKLKAAIEALSGHSLDDVRVHYSSPRPSRIDALAYTQGSDIHVAPGEESHLPHEAWHVVQQAQGRVRPTMQMTGGPPVNDDDGLEREADLMGAKALQARGERAPHSSPSLASASVLSLRAGPTPVIQMVKYIRKSGKIREVPDDYRKKKGEAWANDDDLLRLTGGGAGADDRREQIRRERAEAERAARRKERAERKARVTPAHMPEAHLGKQVKYPGVVGRADNRNADLVYRGMSVNNVLNMQEEKDAVFTVQHPGGTASALDHIVDDSETSPYLSFEAGGLGISAGKYAAKPVDPASHKPYGVEQRAGGFLKQEKSYTAESHTTHPHAKRIGYVGGIPSTAGVGRLDVSDTRKAETAFSPPPVTNSGPKDRRRKAVDLAVADKEVLVKPGEGGITPVQVPFVAKVQEVDEAYYRKHLTRQNSRKALGYYKPYDAAPTYSKIQVAAREGDQYKFAVPTDLRRADDDSESEMSEIEDINLEDYV